MYCLIVNGINSTSKFNEFLVNGEKETEFCKIFILKYRTTNGESLKYKMMPKFPLDITSSRCEKIVKLNI